MKAKHEKSFVLQASVSPVSPVVKDFALLKPNPRLRLPKPANSSLNTPSPSASVSASRISTKNSRLSPGTTLLRTAACC